MRKTIKSALILFVLVTMPAFAEKPVDNTAAVRKVVDAANVAMMDSWKKGDATSFASYFAEDATIMTMNHANIQGRKNIEQLRAQTIKMVPLKTGTTTTSELQVSGDLAYETGSYAYTLQPPGQAVQTINGRYLAVWKKQKDGSWKIQVHASLPDAHK